MQTIATLLIHYRYAVLFPLAAFEGPVVSFITGVLVSLGYFNPVFAYPILVLGDIIPDSVYFFIGRFGHKKNLIARYGSKVGITEARFEIIRRLWHTHSFKTMFLSKLAYGLSSAFLVAAGVAGVPVGKFYVLAVPITFAQYAILMALGYYFGDSFVAVSAYLKDVQIFFLIAAVLLLAGYYRFMVSIRRRFLEDSERKK